MTFLRALVETADYVGRHLVAAVVVVVIVFGVADAFTETPTPAPVPVPVDSPAVGEPMPDLGPMRDLLEGLDVDQPVTLRPSDTDK